MPRPQLHYNTSRISLHVSNRLLDAARVLGQSRAMPLSDIVRLAIREYVVRELAAERDLRSASLCAERELTRPANEQGGACPPLPAAPCEEHAV